ncbi:MAG: thioredoxin domain-containing protein [Alistipes sp.]|nr:thioredoxin domain-containing protein [Alistipes senegalensis]MCM1251158.1 thioredoxin domain-containing protein [Alistipes sp.]
MQDMDKIIWRDALTLVDFFASWCGPCRMMHPIVDRFKEQMRGRVDVYKIDVDDRDMADFVSRYRIASVPTLIFFRRGEILWRQSGMMSYEQLTGVFEKLEKTERVEQS